MNKSVPDPEEEKGQDEQLYIDAEMGFSILHPLLWTKIQIPVSSPDYRQDSISWKIPVGDATGNMEIRVFPALDSADRLAEIQQEYLDDKPEHSSEEVVPYQHTAGDAIATTIYYQKHTQRLFAMLGEKQSYVLSFFASSESFAEHLPQFERVAESFREL